MPDHGRLPGALQDLGGRGAVEERDQAQKSGLAHPVVAYRQDTAAWVQLRDSPRRITVAGVPDVDGDDAAKLMGHVARSLKLVFLLRIHCALSRTSRRNS